MWKRKKSTNEKENLHCSTIIKHSEVAATNQRQRISDLENKNDKYYLDSLVYEQTTDKLMTRIKDKNDLLSRKGGNTHKGEEFV